MHINKVEVLGLDWALLAMRMPFLSDGDGGKADYSLAKKLITAGAEHRKFLRQVTIQMDIEASMTFWFEFDTYKIGVTSNSESFWNTISKNKELSIKQFVIPDKPNTKFYIALEKIIKIINKYWKDESPPKEVLRYLVPQGVKYQRIVTMTGEAYLNMIMQRKYHRLREWQDFILQSRNLMPNNFNKILLSINE